MSSYSRLRERTAGRSLFKKEIIKCGLSDFYLCCCVCGWNESCVDLAHVYPFNKSGLYTFDNIVPLCPNHHRIHDRGIKNEIHLEAIHGFLLRIALKLER